MNEHELRDELRGHPIVVSEAPDATLWSKGRELKRRRTRTRLAAAAAAATVLTVGGVTLATGNSLPWQPATSSECVPLHPVGPHAASWPTGMTQGYTSTRLNRREHVAVYEWRGPHDITQMVSPGRTVEHEHIATDEFAVDPSAPDAGPWVAPIAGGGEFSAITVKADGCWVTTYVTRLDLDVVHDAAKADWIPVDSPVDSTAGRALDL